MRINQYKLVGSVKICVETNKRTTNQIKIFNIIIKSFILFPLSFDDLIISDKKIIVNSFRKVHSPILKVHKHEWESLIYLHTQKSKVQFGLLHQTSHKVEI